MRTRSRLATFLLAAVFVVGSAACSDDNGGTIDAGDGDSDLIDPNTPVDSGELPVPVDPGIGGAIPVTPTPGLDNPRPTAIDNIRLIDDTTIELTFYNGVDACYGLDHVTVEESADAVTIEVVTGGRPEARGQACIELAQLNSTIVTLAAPLGTRPVIDAGTGAPVTPHL